MNKYLKFTVVAAALVLSVALSASAHAAAQFAVQSGQYPSDYPLVQVKDCPGTSYCDASGYSTSVSNVQPGDRVAVMLYYHNVGNTTATNTLFTLSPETAGPTTSQTFSASLTADNANYVTGSATVNLSQSETLTYDTAVLYDNNGATQIALPNGETGSQVFTGSGLNIGSVLGENTCPISNIFCQQGNLVVTYLVGQQQPQQTCSITEFSASPLSVTSGGSATVTWNTSGCVSATVSGGNLYSSSLSGSQNTQALYNTTTYTITAYGSNGTPLTQSQTVTVGQPQQTCSITEFNASPSNVASGGSSNLVWNTSGCLSATVSGGVVYSSSLSGSQNTQALYATTTYTLTAYPSSGSPISQQQTVTVNQPQQTCSITQFVASPLSVTSGGSANIVWSTSGCSSATLSGGAVYASSLTGSQSTQALYTTTTYTLTAYPSSGSPITQQQTVTVSQQPQACAVTQFSASPLSVTSGGSSTIIWSTTGCVSATVSGGVVYSSSLSGSQNTQALYNTTTYTLTATGSTGSPIVQTQTVYVDQQTEDCQISYFTASPTDVSYGGTSELEWATSGCTSVSLSGSGVYNTNQSLSGSLPTVPIYNTQTYTIYATGQSGSQQQQTVTITANGNQEENGCYINYFTGDPTYVYYGGTSTLQWSTTGCESVTVSGANLYNNYNQSLSGSVATGAIYGSETYTLYAYGENGGQQEQTVTITTDESQQQDTCYINYFTASPTSIAAGSSSTLSWYTTGCTNASLSGYTGSLSSYQTTGTLSTGALYNTTTYTLNAYSSYGGSPQQSQSVTVSVNGNTNTNQDLSVYTNTPSLVGETAARFNGLLTQSDGQAQTYFEWGTNQSSLTNSTTPQTVTSGESFYTPVTGLSPDTTYYYEAVASYNGSTAYGGIQSFSTEQIPTTTTVTEQPPTVITQVVSGTGSGSDLVSLDVNNNQQINACVGNIVTYSVNYKNISNSALNNAVIQFTLPQDVAFQSSNPGIYNSADHTVTFSMGTLTAGQSGTMTVTGAVSSSSVNQNLIVASATLAFTNSADNSQQSATAYGLGNTSNCATNSLAGLALFGDGFWPTTLIGWLILILILLLLIWLATVIYRSSARHPVVYNNVYGPANGNSRPNGNGGMNNGNGTMNGNLNGNNGNAQPHYEDMDIPTYGGNH